MYRHGVVNRLVRRCADRPWRAAALLVAAVGCALVLVLTGCSRSSGTSVVLGPTAVGPRAASGAAGSTYTLMQWNVCLSGLAGCHDPAAVDEAVARIRQARPDAVTFNEACQADVARIARATGYHARFSRVVYRGRLLNCVRPDGRGLFGDAVLTKAAIQSTEEHDFKAQVGIERRRWLCVTTGADVEVCTAHLNTRSATELTGNDAQCAELATILARRATTRTVIFGGDVNRHRSCAPAGLWTRADTSADQDPGLQQVYGGGALRAPSARVVPAVHSDHDILLVRAHRAARRPG